MYEYGLRFSPQYEEDLTKAMNYISYVLLNPDSARKLYGKLDVAIVNRLPNAESFEPYHSRKDRENVYYRIYVDNYVVYYVVREVDGKKVMEVRRLLHQRQDREQNV